MLSKLWQTTQGNRFVIRGVSTSIMPLLLKFLQHRELQLQVQFLWLQLLLVRSVTIGFFWSCHFPSASLGHHLMAITIRLFLFAVWCQHAVTVEMLPMHICEQAFLYRLQLTVG